MYKLGHATMNNVQMVEAVIDLARYAVRPVARSTEVMAALTG